MTDALVVGGGIVGASVAYHLARDGVDTLLVDRDDEGQATDAAAGVVSPATSSQNADPEWYDLAVAAFRDLPDLVAALEAEQDGPTGYAAPGLLAVAVDEDELDEFESTWARIERRIGEAGDGYLAPGTVGEVDPEEAVDLVPALAEPRRALRFEEGVRIDGRTFAAALVRAGESHGLRAERVTVESLDLEDGEVRGVVTGEGDRIEADGVVIAGGAWSRDFADQLGVEVPVEPVRGQVVRVTPHGMDPAEWPIVISFRDSVMAPWPDGQVAVGATREPDAGFAPRMTVAGVRSVLDEAVRVLPGLADAEVTAMSAGLRPVSGDELPVLGPVPGVDGAYLATGHGATGITHGPYTGKLVARAVQGRTPEYDISDLGVSRFG